MSRSALEKLVTEFHDIRNTDFETDDAYDTGFDRREAIKVELAGLLESLTPADQNDELVEFVESLAEDRYLLIKRHVTDAIDRMNGIVKAPPRWEDAELIRVALEGAQEEIDALETLIASRGDDATFDERFAEHAARVRVGEEPDEQLFLYALNHFKWFHHQIMEPLAAQFEWRGFERLMMEGNFSHAIDASFPRTYERYRYGDRKFLGKTADDLNALLLDHRIVTIESVIDVAEKLFPTRCAAAIALAKERQDALRNAWSILTTSDIDAIETFLGEFTISIPAPLVFEASSHAPFSVTTNTDAIIAFDRWGDRFELKAKNDDPTALAWDAMHQRVIVGTGSGVFAFDPEGALLYDVSELRGQAVHSIDIHVSGKALVVQTERVSVVDLQSQKVVFTTPKFVMNDTMRAAWSPSGSKFAFYGLVIEIYDATRFEVVHQTLRLEEEWRTTPAFCWLTDDIYLATISIQVGERDPRPTTRFVDLNDESRARECMLDLQHITKVGGELVAQRMGTWNTTHDVEWFAAEDLNAENGEADLFQAALQEFTNTTGHNFDYAVNRATDSFAWSVLRSFSFGDVYRAQPTEHGVFINSKKGLYFWGGEEPERLRDSVLAFCVGENDRVFFITDEGEERFRWISYI